MTFKANILKYVILIGIIQIIIVTTFKVTHQCAHMLFLYSGFPDVDNETASSLRLAAC